MTALSWRDVERLAPFDTQVAFVDILDRGKPLDRYPDIVGLNDNDEVNSRLRCQPWNRRRTDVEPTCSIDTMMSPTFVSRSTTSRTLASASTPQVSRRPLTGRSGTLVQARRP
jgi:hypothetical protein